MILTISVEQIPHPRAVVPNHKRGEKSFEVTVAGTWHRIFCPKAKVEISISDSIDILEGNKYVRKKSRKLMWSSRKGCRSDLHEGRPLGVPGVERYLCLNGPRLKFDNMNRIQCQINGSTLSVVHKHEKRYIKHVIGKMRLSSFQTSFRSSSETAWMDSEFSP